MFERVLTDEYISRKAGECGNLIGRMAADVEQPTVNKERKLLNFFLETVNEIQNATSSHETHHKTSISEEPMNDIKSIKNEEGEKDEESDHLSTENVELANSNSTCNIK